MTIEFNPTGLVNKVYQPFLFASQRTQIFFGGSSSGKSVFLAERVVLDVLSGRNYLIVRNTGNTLKKSCWNEIIKAISLFKLNEYFDIAKSDMTITCNLNDKQILFSGLDDVEKVKSITPMKGALTDIWIEEGTEVNYEDYKQLRKRLRGYSKHSKRITISFNPIYQTHWIYTEFFKEWEDNKNLYQSDSLLILKTTHKDNEFLSQDDHDELENEKDPYYYQVYTLGNWGVLGDRIFTNWHIEDLSVPVKVLKAGQEVEVPLQQTFDNIRNGLDFGFAQDPSAFVKLNFDRKNKKIYVFQEYYEKGKTNYDLAQDIKPYLGYQRVIADSAEQKSIQELKDNGINAAPAFKGGDSVRFGIQWLQGYEIIIDKSCQNLKNELTLYQWKKDKDGNTIKQPVDKYNHLIDAMRYALSEDMDRIPPARILSKKELGL